MTNYTIPISGAADGPFYFTVDLSGTMYQLAFDFNDRDSAWYMTIRDTAGNMLRSGIRVVVNYDLLKRWVGTTVPAGELAVFDRREVPVDPTEDGLGLDALLTYHV